MSTFYCLLLLCIPKTLLPELAHPYPKTLGAYTTNHKAHNCDALALLMVD